MMSDDSLVPQAYATVLKHFVQHGRAPYYTEIANILDISMDEARILLRDTAAGRPSPVAGFRMTQITLSLGHLSQASPPILGCPSMASRSGMPSEGWKRWQCAGSSRVKKFA